MRRILITKTLSHVYLVTAFHAVSRSALLTNAGLAYFSISKKNYNEAFTAATVADFENIDDEIEDDLETITEVMDESLSEYVSDVRELSSSQLSGTQLETVTSNVVSNNDSSPEKIRRPSREEDDAETDDDDIPSAPRRGKVMLINVADRFDARLRTLPNVPVSNFSQMTPDDAISLAEQYIAMQHYCEKLKKHHVPHRDHVLLDRIREESLISVALFAVEKRSVPLELAVKLLMPRFTISRFARHRKFLSVTVKAWVIEEILANNITPELAQRILPCVKYFGRDTRVVGALAQKAIEEMTILDTENLIKIMFNVADSHVAPPSSFWTIILRQVVRNIRKSDSDVKPRQCFRILEICARVNVVTDVNLLIQICECAWKSIAKGATDVKFPPQKMLTYIRAINRLSKVTQLMPQQFFRLIQISGSLGVNFNAGRGVITDDLLIPLVWHLNDLHLSELLEALSVSHCRYPPVYQAIIDRIVHQGTNSPVCLIQVGKLLRCISRKGDLCSQLRLALFFDLFEEVTRHKKVLRMVQMAHLVDDIYFICRRFSRTAPLVLRLHKVVDEFCMSVNEALEKGLASLDQVNHILELTVMMGMQTNEFIDYPHLAKLREQRNELYKGVEAGDYPEEYRKRMPQNVRFLFNEIVMLNQCHLLYMQAVDRRSLMELHDVMSLSGPYGTARAIWFYHTIHGEAMPLSPYLQRFLMRYFNHKLIGSKVGDSLDDLKHRAQILNFLPFTKDHLKVFMALIVGIKPPIPGLSKHASYMTFLEAVATALNDGDALKKLSRKTVEALY